MTWLQRYQLSRTLRWSLWLMPVLGIGLALALAPFLRWLDGETKWSWFNVSPDGARAILGAFTSSMLTFVVFVVSSLLIVVQLASAQLTPRVIVRVFASRTLKWVLAFFTFSYTYTIAASGRIEDTAPQLPVAFAILCNLASLALFFWFAQSLGTSLRPITVLQGVAEERRDVVANVYPQIFNPAEEQTGWVPAPDSEASIVEHTGWSGVVLAFAPCELVAIAKRDDVVVEMVPQVGDFLARGDVLFRVRTGGRAVDAEALRACIAVGSERTMEQDPRFSFRIMVDIASKALSPAINDPTTAVLALDQIHRLLMYVGKRRLDEGLLRDAEGRLRLCYGTPDWLDFVTLAVSEIRHFGASSMQVARRLEAMLDHLLRVLPEARKAALHQEHMLLQRAIQRAFPDEEDLARARIGDLQGVGGSE